MAITLNQIRNQNEIQENEFEEVAKLIYNSFLIKKSRKDKTTLEKQTYLISLFTEMLNKYVELQKLTDKKRKLKVINFIDKLNLQKELLDLQKGVTKISDIKETAQRFGRKAQTSVQ